MLRIGKEFADGMIAHSQEEDPNECCGILSGEGDTIHKLYRITNTKSRGFSPGQLLRKLTSMFRRR